MGIKTELWTFIIAASPLIELRGAIPFAIKNGISFKDAFFIAVLGNTLPIVPLLFILDWAVRHLRHLPYIGNFLNWWFARVESKSKIVRTWGFWGLVLFVAVPLPASGVWSGSVAATLLEFKKPRAFGAIFLGMLMAAFVIVVLSEGVRQWFISI